MLTSSLLAFKDKPIIVCPAMNTAMYENAVTQENIARLKNLGYHFVEPRNALLACGDTGKGALADINDIVNKVEELLN